jgi:hypothetical protein
MRTNRSCRCATCHGALRRHPRPDRTERRRQDDAVQLSEPALPAEPGEILMEGHQHPPVSAAARSRDRHRPHVPERRAVSHACRCATTSASADTARTKSDFVSDALKLPWVARAGAQAQREFVETRSSIISTCTTLRTAVVAACPSARRSASSWPRAGRRTEDPAARRARRRPQSRGSLRSRRPDLPHPRRARTSRCCWSSITWAW